MAKMTDKAPNGRSRDEAYSELEREWNLRSRCFPAWVKDGRLNRIDAADRRERLAAALFFVQDGLVEDDSPSAKEEVGQTKQSV